MVLTWKKLLVLPFALFALTGCTHSLRITNLGDYFAPPVSSPEESLRIGITSGSDSHIQNSRYVSSIVDALQRNGSIEKVIYPYNAAVQNARVDVLLDISVNPKYSGRGSNFFVNWPGFLIWAPAIWGYGYNAEIETRVNINRQNKNQSQQIIVMNRYKFRQAEFDRTWTEIGWLEVSIIPFIGGIAFIQYDPDVTDEFITKVYSYYGPYVASKILAAL